MNLKMQPPLRIAMLECDAPLPRTREKFNGYGEVFEFLLRSGARSLGRPDLETGFKITKHPVEQDPEAYPNLEDIDAILITGSKHDSFADTPWITKLVDFTTKVLAQDRVRIIGVCFGHQIVGRALGAEVGRNPHGWEASVNEVELSERGKELFGKDKISLHQMHRDCVYSYPQGVEEIGYSPICKVQGLYALRRLITLQGHPEFNEEIMTEIVETRHSAGIFDDEAFHTHLKNVGLPHDGLLASKAFIRFLLEE